MTSDSLLAKDCERARRWLDEVTAENWPGTNLETDALITAYAMAVGRATVIIESLLEAVGKDREKENER